MLPEIEKAQSLWMQFTKLARKRTPLSKDDFLTKDSPLQPTEGWLRHCRESLLLSQNEVATRLKISKQAYAKLELREPTRKISLESLESAAQAMDCEVILYLRPKSRKLFAEILWEGVLTEALIKYCRRMRSQRVRRPIVLASIASGILVDTKHRRKMKWAQKRAHLNQTNN